MVSVLCPSRHLDSMPPSVDYPVLYPPPPLPLSRPPHLHPQPPSHKFQMSRSSAYYARSPPQRSNSTAANALHLRSQSVPEAVYLAEQQQQQQQIGLPVVLQRGSPTKQLRVMHYGLHHHHHLPPPPPSVQHGGGLRRSHTNATEFAASRRRFQSGAAKLGVSYTVQQRQFGSNQHLNHLNVELNSFFPPPLPPMPPPPPPAAVPLPGHLAGFQPEEPRSYIHQQQQQRGSHHLSRSRSNVASLRPNPPQQQQRQPFQLHHNPLYTRSTSHLFRQGESEFSRLGESAFSTSRGCSSLQMLLLQQPLHVDCSIEYDLGKQPLIPAGSEPLLIVDPTYSRGEDQLIRSAPLSLNSPRPFAEGIVAPSKTSTPKKRETAVIGRRASFLEERSSGGSCLEEKKMAPLRRPKGMSVREENEEEELTAAEGHRQRHLQRESEQRRGFHLSMPEIAIGDDNDDGDRDNGNRSAARQQHHHHRHNHRHHHHHRRCRTETESSVVSRKVSSESSSGMDSGAGSTSSMFQRFSQLKSGGAKFKPISDQQNSSSSQSGGGGGGGGNLQRSQACDSGLGTPSSQSILKSTSAVARPSAAAEDEEEGEEEEEEREIQVIQFLRHQLRQEGRSVEAASNGNGDNRSNGNGGGSKWKSSVTGK